jgi:hypothetical protein
MEARGRGDAGTRGRGDGAGKDVWDEAQARPTAAGLRLDDEEEVSEDGGRTHASG